MEAIKKDHITQEDNSNKNAISTSHQVHNIIDGKKIAQEIYDEIKSEVDTLKKKPTMAAILVWDSPSSKVYIAQKEKWAKYTWINFQLTKLEEKIKEEELLREIEKLNKDENINGYIVQLPLPKHISENNVTQAIDPKKDIDGFHPVNQWNIVVWDYSLFVPCTPDGIMEIFKRKNIELEGKIVTVIGTSNIVWKPIANLLTNAHATVTSCNSKTKKDFLKERTKESDIVVIATWVPKLLTADMIGEKTVIIDVWITKMEDGSLSGDADFDNIVTKGNLITPVPGLVWRLTVAMLMKNTLKAYKSQNKNK